MFLHTVNYFLVSSCDASVIYLPEDKYRIKRNVDRDLAGLEVVLATLDEKWIPQSRVILT